MYEEHPSFSSLDPDQVIWRFMDFAAFVSLVQTSSLWFASIESFDDPYEMSWQGYVPDREQLPPERRHIFDSTREKMRSDRWTVFANCWHQNDEESAAMWKLYSADAGVAIRTTFGDLCKAFAPETDWSVHVGSVRYIVYGKEHFELNKHTSNVFTPALYKRKSFEHEQEVRAIVWSVPRTGHSDRIGPGVSVSVDLSALIHEIICAPTSEGWFCSIVEGILSKYGIQKPIRRSGLLVPAPY